VPAVLLSATAAACGEAGRFEAQDRAYTAIFEGDVEGLVEEVRSNPTLKSGESASYLLGVSACHPDMMSAMVDDLGFDTNAAYLNNMTALFSITFNEDAQASDNWDCSESTVQQSLKILLEGGADPCLSPSDDSTLKPVLKAEEWGNSPEVVALLNEYASNC